VTVSVQKRTVPQEPARVEPTIEPAALADYRKTEAEKSSPNTS